MSAVLVTGGTGTLGTRLVPILRDRGHHVWVLSRGPSGDPDVVRGDLLTGTRLHDIVDGADAIVHAATEPVAGGVDRTGTKRLVAAAAEARIPHLILTSIVGIDQIPLRHYRAKLAAEYAVTRGDIPWTIQRFTQFHQVLSAFLRRSYRLRRTWIPRGLSFQPIDPAAVAAAVVEAVEAGPRERMPDLGGPEVLAFEDMARSVSTALGRSGSIARLPVLGRTWRAVKRGHNLADLMAEDTTTWADHLEELEPA